MQNKDLRLFSAIIQSKMIKEEKDDGGVLWRCLECGHSSKWKHNVVNHIDSLHLENDGFNCQFCGKFCRSKNGLQIHVTRYHRGQFNDECKF